MAAAPDDSPLLREVFGVLLELRAHAEAQGAQLEGYSFNGNELAATDIVDVTDPVICDPLPGEFPLGTTARTRSPV